MEYIKPELQAIFLSESNDIITESNSDGLTNIGNGGSNGGSWSEWI